MDTSPWRPPTDPRVWLALVGVGVLAIILRALLG